MAKPLAKLLSKLTPKRRWAQFSLASMLGVVTVLCLWLGRHMQAVNQQRAAVAAINALDGVCYYDYQYNGEFVYDAQPPGPDWLREGLGINHLANVTRVSLSRTDPSTFGKALPYLRHMPWLARLELKSDDSDEWNPTATEAEPLKLLTGLRELQTEVVSDSLLKAIASLPRLDDLTISANRLLEENELRQIGQMTRLRKLLVLRCAGITGYVHLTALTNLEVLY